MTAFSAFGDRWMQPSDDSALAVSSASRAEVGQPCVKFRIQQTYDEPMCCEMMSTALEKPRRANYPVARRDWFPRFCSTPAHQALDARPFKCGHASLLKFRSDAWSRTAADSAEQLQPGTRPSNSYRPRFRPTRTKRTEEVGPAGVDGIQKDVWAAHQ